MAPKYDTGVESHVSGQSNTPLSRPAHALSHEKLVEEIGANVDDGLKEEDARQRLEKYGPNELGEGEGVKPLKILIRQVANAMTLVLLLAMAVSFGIESWIEGGVVAGVIALNIIVGFFQEFNAEKTMDSLRSLSSPTANTVRNGKTISVPTREVVPGDMVELKTGDTIPADVRLVEAVNFETDEALLTGESLPVEKKADLTFDDETGPGDRLNIAYSSSTVTKGRARGIVFATGMYTEIGSIAAALRNQRSRRRSVIRREDGTVEIYRYAQAWLLTISDAIGHFLGISVGTPLQRKLSRLAVLLFLIAIVCAIIVLGVNGFSSEREVIIYAVATGLSMIPASLIVVLTITMAAGTKIMVGRHVIVRKMDALEALGAVTDICSDKTGTLTQGKMVTKKAWIPAKGTYSIGTTNQPINPTIGDLSFRPAPPKDIGADEVNEREGKSGSFKDLLKDNQPLEEFLKVASLANLAHVHETEGEWKARGDPTEIAIQVFASRFDWNRAPITSGPTTAWKQLAEFPFDSDVKKMSVIFKETATNKKYVFTKGAVERIIRSCTTIHLRDGEDPVPVTEDIRHDILKNMESIAAMGLRCLALASKPYEGEIENDDEMDRSEIERDLIFRGLVGLYDPPRPESERAVKECHKAGIAVHMLTGDHKETARAIAAQVGILPPRMETLSKEVADAMVMTAGQFDKLSDGQIDQLPVLPLVIARCAPSTKVRMIEALHRRKKFAAMTGDGVNDSPSLKRADVGIAMGQAGSDVAKDASDIILTDDNFASILNAVEEGRRMFDNIQKFVLHLLAQNVAQALVLLIGLMFKDDRGLSVFPLAPVQILWVIMITSGLPDMGLGFERAAPDIMRRPPVSLKSGVFSIELLVDMLVYGILVAALVLGSFALVVFGFGDGTLGGSTPQTGCNDSYSPECDLVFRARGTAFASLTWLSLFLAWEMLSFRRSFFNLQPAQSSNKSWFMRFIDSIWQNQFLFWCIIFGFVTIFATLYIPVINSKVFLHTGITWEWAIVFISAGLFFIGAESWKWAKRVFLRWRESRKDDIEASDPTFGAFLRSGTNSSLESEFEKTVEDF